MFYCLLHPANMQLQLNARRQLKTPHNRIENIKEVPFAWDPQ